MPLTVQGHPERSRAGEPNPGQALPTAAWNPLSGAGQEEDLNLDGASAVILTKIEMHKNCTDLTDSQFLCNALQNPGPLYTINLLLS